MQLVRPQKPIEYPDGDGNPMAENTLQFEWIVTIKENLETLFAERADVFVAGDLLWYPAQGHPEIRLAPDALVAFGRPKGYRGSYMQWVEEGIAPQIVFEVLSPGNRPSEMTRKFKFYEHYGVDEYYIYDPDHNELTGWLRQGAELQEIPSMDGWTSPRLGIRFERGDVLTIRNPDGSPFLSAEKLFKKCDRLNQEREQAERDLQLANWERDKAVTEKAALEGIVAQQAADLAQLRARLESRTDA